jgi:hypothetical protein
MDRTESLVNRQVGAMGAQVFEIGLYKPGAASGEAVMIPRTWDRDTLLRSIPWLRLQNMNGRNIYMRPKGEHDLSLVDDLKPEALARMRAEGFRPAVEVETSPGNFQAWLKHPAQLPRDVSTAAARALAARFGGDLGAADWRHFGRLSGFTNRKPKYQTENGLYPFVRLAGSSGATYPEGEHFIRQIRTTLEEERSRKGMSTQFAEQATSRNGPTKEIDAFRANPVYGGDGTRIDLAYAIYALAHGGSESQVRAAIRSRDLTHKGTEKRQEEYIDRTLKKASTILSGQGYGYGR